MTTSYTIRPIGHVESPVADVAEAPKQGGESAPDAWLVLVPEVVAGLQGVTLGDELLVLTWLHEARRDVLAVHPRGDEANPETGVFRTRSPHRPNPIGLHPVRVLAVEGDRVHVRPLEAIDGTPIVDIKSVLPPSSTSR